MSMTEERNLGDHSILWSVLLVRRYRPSSLDALSDVLYPAGDVKVGLTFKTEGLFEFLDGGVPESISRYKCK